MEVMGVVAVMVNLALLGMGGSVQRMFPNMTVTDRIILIIVLEVSMFWTLSVSYILSLVSLDIWHDSESFAPIAALVRTQLMGFPVGALHLVPS